MFNSIDEIEAKNIVDNCEWILKSDLKTRDVADDGETRMIMATYSGKQSFGVTDYQDHRKDTLEQLKNKIYKNITNGGGQRLHYYENRDQNTPFKKIVVQGYLGGYTGYFI